MTKYRYKLSRMGASSDKYGPCEVCKKQVSDVYLQTESHDTSRGTQTYAGCHSIFGHEGCLISKRRYYTTMKLYDHVDGYIEAVVDGNRTLLHRVLYEKYHGVKLTKKDIIHHIDGDKENNNVSNLKLMTKQEHSKLHALNRPQKMRDLKCMQCDTDYQIPLSVYNYKIKKGQRIFVCSKQCAGLLNSKYLPIKKTSTEYLKNVLDGLEDGLTGYAIALKYNMNRKTVYNIINSLK